MHFLKVFIFNYQIKQSFIFMAERLNENNQLDRSKREEWGLIIEHNAKEFQRLQAVEKQKNQAKKLAYKYALDRHLQERKLTTTDEKEEDRRYFNIMMQNNAKLQQQQNKKRKELEQKLKLISSLNRNEIYNKRSPNSDSPKQNATSINVGQNEEILPQKKEETKKILMGFYENHLHQKRIKQEAQRIHDQELLKKQVEIANKREQQRNLQHEKILNMKQKEDVYKYYQFLDQINKKKQRELQQKIVDKASQQIKQKQQQRIQRDRENKFRMNQSIKDSILQQIQKHNQQKEEYKRKKSQEIINSRFNEEQDNNKIPKINKSEYLSYLLKQQEMQKLKKNQVKFMNDHEYKINTSELNKVYSRESPNLPSRNTSPLYIGSNEEDRKKKDEIYFKSLGFNPLISPLNISKSFNEEQQIEFKQQTIATTQRNNIKTNLEDSRNRRGGSLIKQGYNIINGVYS